jgi:integrase
MAIRQREWVTSKGKRCSAWVVDYFDAGGTRRLKTFHTKREADDWRSSTRVDLKAGTHVADRASITVEKAGQSWVDTAVADGLEAGTIEGYRLILRKHIAPYIGATRLNAVTGPAIRKLEDDLLADGRSRDLIRRVVVQLGAIIADAVDRGDASHNPVQARKRRSRRSRQTSKRHTRRLEVGVDIPAPAEIRAVLKAAAGRDKALFSTAALCGLRASELRGLRWQDVDFAAGTLTVAQRADKFRKVGSPKTATSRRTLPLPGVVASALKTWKVESGNREGLVFPGKGGKPSTLHPILNAWADLQVKAKVVVDDAAKYAGVHCLRHFYASWCAAPVPSGGLGLPLKTVQVRMGHSTLAMTADRYGHLFPSTDDAAVLAAGERALMDA